MMTMRATHTVSLLIAAALCIGSCRPVQDQPNLVVQQGPDQIRIFIEGRDAPIATHNVQADFRPYLHPIVAPDGNGRLTEFSPDHHRHQTGLYWGFTRLNGRDYFHNPQADYWRRDTVMVIEAEGRIVRWRTVYDLLGEAGEPVLTETQDWSMQLDNADYVLDLDWHGYAHTDVTIGEYDYGGLFLRMPWSPGIRGFAVNAARQRNQVAEGQRAMWLDLGIQVPGREDLAHMAILDHPGNEAFPHPWRVDYQLGVGPVQARMGDWTIKSSQGATVRHRILMYTGAHRELRAAWEEYAGREGEMYSTAALWGVAQQEGRMAKFLTPDEAAKAMTPLDGYQVEAWAGEPMVTQPMAFAWDDRGRLWIAENRDYETRSTGFSGSGDSRIVILEDADRDGKADTRTVFMEGIAFPSALAVGFDGVFVGAPPHLLFVPDRDGDDRADMDAIEIRLTGWGIRDRHETINSFHWGPDGWLYGLEGFATTSSIHKPAPDARLYGHNDPYPEAILKEEGTEINGGVWRYHPVRERFEVVAHGFSNPWGIDYDEHGEFFISACVIPHVFHVIPGGLYQRQGGRHYNPYAYTDIGPIVDHRHRSAHGGARVYQSDAFPQDQRGKLFMANIHEHAILTDILEQAGSGYVARHGDEFLHANNAQWVGFSVEIGPDGAVYVLDWHDADICGGEVLDMDTGRVFRIAPQQTLAEDFGGRYDDLRDRTDMELARLQRSGSDWHTRRARVILQHRGTVRGLDADAEAALRDQFDSDAASTYRLKAMWALHVAGLLTGEIMEEALSDPDPYVRAWAVRLLTDQPELPPSVLPRLERLASRDRSPVVRKYLAASLQRLPADQRWEIAAALARREADASDHNIPKLLWLGIEPLVVVDPPHALAWAEKSRMPMLTEFVGRRLVDAGLTEALLDGLLDTRKARVGLLRGMRAALEGRQNLVAPEAWAAVLEALESDRRTRDLGTAIAQLFGDAEASNRLAGVALGSEHPADERRDAVRTLARTRRDTLHAALPVLLHDRDVRTEAIRAVAAYDDEDLAAQLLEQYPDASPDEKQAIILTLASRPQYGRMLVDAFVKGDVARQDIPGYVARQLRRVAGSGFVEVWGPIDQMPGNREAVYGRYRALLTQDRIRTANVMRGHQVFQQRCGVCHRMYGEGGEIGPDITGSNRTSIDYLLSNLLNPSEDIQDDYRMVVVTMRDGRTYLGSIGGETDRQLTMQVVGLGTVVLDKSDVQSRETSNSSLMPEGTLERLTDAEVLNLVAFLQTSEGPSS